MGNNPMRYNDPMGNDTLPSGKYIWESGAQEEINQLQRESPDGEVWLPLTFSERLYVLGENIGLFTLPEAAFAKGAEATKGAKAADVKLPEVKTPEVKVPEIKTPEVKSLEVKVDKPYQRPANATTKEQKASVQNKPCTDCGATAKTMVADHKKPLVKEYFETGKIDKTNMHATSSVQPQCPTCSAKQGAE
jgi:hypothetical protein